MTRHLLWHWLDDGPPQERVENQAVSSSTAGTRTAPNISRAQQPACSQFTLANPFHAQCIYCRWDGSGVTSNQLQELGVSSIQELAAKKEARVAARKALSDYLARPDLSGQEKQHARCAYIHKYGRLPYQCSGCWLLPGHCVCGQLRKAQPATKVVIHLHQDEWGRGEASSSRRFTCQLLLVIILYYVCFIIISIIYFCRKKAAVLVKGLAWLTCGFISVHKHSSRPVCWGSLACHLATELLPLPAPVLMHSGRLAPVTQQHSDTSGCVTLLDAVHICGRVWTPAIGSHAKDQHHDSTPGLAQFLLLPSPPPPPVVRRVQHGLSMCQQPIRQPAAAAWPRPAR